MNFILSDRLCLDLVADWLASVSSRVSLLDWVKGIICFKIYASGYGMPVCKHVIQKFWLFFFFSPESFRTKISGLFLTIQWKCWFWHFPSLACFCFVPEGNKNEWPAGLGFVSFKKNVMLCKTSTILGKSFQKM